MKKVLILLAVLYSFPAFAKEAPESNELEGDRLLENHLRLHDFGKVLVRESELGEWNLKKSRLSEGGINRGCLYVRDNSIKEMEILIIRVGPEDSCPGHLKHKRHKRYKWSSPKVRSASRINGKTVYCDYKSGEKGWRRHLSLVVKGKCPKKP